MSDIVIWSIWFVVKLKLKSWRRWGKACRLYQALTSTTVILCCRGPLPGSYSYVLNEKKQLSCQRFITQYFTLNTSNSPKGANISSWSLELNERWCVLKYSIQGWSWKQMVRCTVRCMYHAGVNRFFLSARDDTVEYLLVHMFEVTVAPHVTPPSRGNAEGINFPEGSRIFSIELKGLFFCLCEL